MMNVFDRLSNAYNAFRYMPAATMKGNRFTEAVVNRWETVSGRFRSGQYTKLMQKYRSWVYVCASRNASRVAQAPLRLYVTKSNGKKIKSHPTAAIDHNTLKYLRNYPSSKTSNKVRKAYEVEEVLEHPFLDLMHRVNPVDTEFTFKQLVVMYLELTGNSYIYLNKDNYGMPQSVWLMPPQNMKIIPDTEKFVAGYVYESMGKKIPYDPEEIVHVRYPNPLDAWYGMGPLQAAMVSVDVSNYMQKYEHDLFKNKAWPEFFLTTQAGQPALSDTQFKRIKDEWDNEYKGDKGTGKMGLLEGGLDIKRFNLTPKELAFLQGRKMTMQEIFGVFGLPISKGTTDNVNLANAQSGDYWWVKDIIQPKCIMIAEKLSAEFVSMYGDNLFCAFDNQVPDDMDFRLRERDANIKNGYSTINQERQKDGEESVPWGDVAWLPGTLLPVNSGKAPERPGFGGMLSVDADLVKELRDVDDEADDHQEKDVEEILWKQFIKRQSTLENAFEKILQSFFKRQEKDVLANMRKSPLKANSAIYFKLHQKGPIENWIFDSSFYNDQMAEKSAAIYLESIRQVAADMFDYLDIADEFNMDRKIVTNFVDKFSKKYAKVTNKTTVATLKTKLQEGIEAGESMPKLRKRVEEVFDFADKKRATMIARSETVRASNFGTEQAMIDSGVVEGKEWLIALDERTCDWCKRMKQKTADLGSNFFEEGDTLDDGKGHIMRFDYSSIPSAPLHPHCRCTLIPIIKE